MTKPKNIIFVPFLLAIFLLVSATNISAEMPDTTPRMPDTTPRMPSFVYQIRDSFSRLTTYFFRMPDTTPRMPDTTPRMPDTTPVMPDILRFLTNMLPSGIRKFLAPPTPSDLPQPLGQWQQEPTKSLTTTPTPTLPKGAVIQTEPFKYKPEGEAAKAGVPAFTISAPSGWARYPVSGTMLSRFESQEVDIETAGDGEVTSNAVIIVRATDGYGSLDDFINDYKASGKNAPGFSQISSQSKNIGPDPGYRLEFTHTSKVDGVNIIIHELDYLSFKSGISFLIKGYAADSAWSARSGEIQSALDSFRFNESP